MFGIEKLIGKFVIKTIDQNYKGKDMVDALAKGAIMIKTILMVYFLAHLISVGLMSWMLYKLFVKKQKTTANLVIPIIGLIVHLFIPYNTTEEIIDMFLGMFSKLCSFAMILAFIGLIMAVVSIVLYFTYKEQKKEDEITIGDKDE